MRKKFPLNNSSLSVAVVIAIIFFAIGCSNTSYLAQGEKLYTGAEVIIHEKEELPDKSELEDQLEILVKPEPNGKFLGLFRAKLWLFNVGIFPESFGEPPILLHTVAPNRIAERMHALLENKGFFPNDVSYTIQEDEHTANIQYNIVVERPYTIHTITLGGEKSALMDTIRSTMTESFLVAGDQYNLDKLKMERERINAALKEKGFYYFSPELIVFQADSAIGNKTIDLTMKIKKDIPVESARIYTIGNIYIYSGYSLNRDSVETPTYDSINIGGYYFIDLDKEFESDVILRSIFFKKGNIYSRNDHDLTINRLMNLGVFRFVNVRFVENHSSAAPQLELHIYLTPLLIKTIRFELQGVSKSNNFAGPTFEASYRDKNFLSGAELLTLSVDIGFETYIGKGESRGNSYEVGTRGELVIPKFVTPFELENISSLFVPKTRIGAGIRLQHRLEYYQLFSTDVSFGYQWKESITKEHIFNPFSITFAQLTRTSEKFEDLLKGNPLLRKSFEEQFIIGQNYSFTYNDQMVEENKNHWFFRGSVDLSGTLLHLGQSLFIDHKATPETPYKIFGKTYSQYYKFDVDLRFYYNTIDRSSSIVGRIIAGIGVAYGNSATLPYVKQFYIGGSNSVRAFPARTLGPGSYSVPDSLRSTSFIDQAGDIKLESSVEYRFPLVSILKGALFVDAGNIWVLRDDPNRPGGTFSGKTFMDQLSVGTGFGLRFDLSFLILRFDLAFPLRIPSLPVNERWVIKDIDFGLPSWRKNNLALNIAIGYPF